MESSTYKDDKTGRTEHYSDSTPLYFSFEKNGQGKIFREGTSGNFSYKYNNKDKSIEYQMDDGQGVWFIDILTEETLIFHEERERKVPMTEIVYHISATYKGKRI